MKAQIFQAFNANQLEKATHLCTKYLDQNSEDDDILALYSSVLLMQNNAEKVILTLAPLELEGRALSLRSSLAIAYMIDADYEQAIPLFKTLNAHAYPDQVQAMGHYTAALFAYQDYQAVISELEGLMGDDMADFDLLERLRLCFCFEKDVAREYQVLKQQHEMRPESAHTLIKLILRARHCGDYDVIPVLLDKMDTGSYPDECRLFSALFLLPQYKDQAELDAWQARFRERVAALSKQALSLNDVSLLDLGIRYLCYQGVSDKALLEDVAKLFQPIVPKLDPFLPNERAKKRVGIYSKTFQTHSSIVFYRQLIKMLSDDFDLYLFEADIGISDTVADFGDVVVHLSLEGSLEEQAKMIRGYDLDVLIYLEMGIELLNYCLGACRLARCQMSLMGFPMSSGLETIDYYVSADIFEPDLAEQHYTESLLRVPGMPIYFEDPEPKALPLTRQDLGLPLDKTLYSCPMLDQKLMPEYDDVLVEIMARDPNGVLLLFDFHRRTNRVGDRLKGRIPESQLQFMDVLPKPAFYAFCREVDVILESFPFGGGNTVLEALGMGTPVVTLKTPYFRGRWGTGYHQLMGLSDLVAAQKSEYVDLACRLGQDPDFRHHVSERINAKRSCLFHQTEGIQYILDFIADLKV